MDLLGLSKAHARAAATEGHLERRVAESSELVAQADRAIACHAELASRRMRITRVVLVRMRTHEDANLVEERCDAAQ